MSDNWITIIPQDPLHVPDEEKREATLRHFRDIAPDSDEIEIKLSEKIRFFDCGANFSSISCPSCGNEIEMEWWQDRMSDDFQEGEFRLEKYEAPCCRAPVSLAELKYDWPQGFARFGLDAMNPNIGELSESHRKEFEDLLGTKLTFIRRHI